MMIGDYDQGQLRQPSSSRGEGRRPVPGFYVSQGIHHHHHQHHHDDHHHHHHMRQYLGEINPRGRPLQQQHN